MDITREQRVTGLDVVEWLQSVQGVAQWTEQGVEVLVRSSEKLPGISGQLGGDFIGSTAIKSY